MHTRTRMHAQAHTHSTPLYVIIQSNIKISFKIEEYQTTQTAFEPFTYTVY